MSSSFVSTKAMKFEIERNIIFSSFCQFFLIKHIWIHVCVTFFFFPYFSVRCIGIVWSFKWRNTLLLIYRRMSNSKSVSFTDEPSRFTRNTIFASLHEQRIKKTYCLLWGCNLLPSWVVWVRMSAINLETKKEKDNEKKISFQRTLNAFPIWSTAPHMLICILS